jgi:hydroxymethylpyrimidine/phosphomethylpyrimidine kinase
MRTVWDNAVTDQTSRIVREEVPRQAAVLVVAGLDPSGGAGLLADVAVVLEHALHPLGVVTALTEQDSHRCTWVHPSPPELVSNQLARLIDDFEIRAVKVGMLASGKLAQAVAMALRRLHDERVPIVVDPVLKATRGVALMLDESSPGVALGPVLEIATLITPNVDELSALTGRSVGDVDELRDAAHRLRSRGTFAVLAKGGHLTGDPVDVLVDGEGDVSMTGRRVEGTVPHGTGCALSSEIACRLAMGAPLREAVLGATERVRRRIAEARTVGRGRPFLGV